MAEQCLFQDLLYSTNETRPFCILYTMPMCLETFHLVGINRHSSFYLCPFTDIPPASIISLYTHLWSSSAVRLCFFQYSALSTLAALVFLHPKNSCTLVSLTQGICQSLSGFLFSVPGNSQHNKLGSKLLGSSIFCLSGVTALCFLMCNVLRSHYFMYSILFSD